MKFFTRLIISAAIAYILSKILSGVHISDFVTALIFALVLAALNALIRPILILLTLPVTVLTLGLFLFVINACIILLGAKLMDGIKVDGFWWALLFSIILSAFNSAADKAINGENEK